MLVLGWVTAWEYVIPQDSLLKSFIFVKEFQEPFSQKFEICYLCQNLTCTVKCFVVTFYWL